MAGMTMRGPEAAVGGRWPPVAERGGAELSLGAVLAIAAGALVAEFLVFEAAANVAPFSAAWSSSPSAAVARQLLLPAALATGVSLGVVLMLGRHRAAGLGIGHASPWATVPLGFLLAGAVLTLTVPGVTSQGKALLALIGAGLVLAAASEEILFRGFLQHGLTRHLGGATAVVLTSAIFAAAHVPSLVRSETPGGAIVGSLVVIFGLGMVLARIRAETGSVWPATGVHALWNIVTIGWVASPSGGSSLQPAFAVLKLVPVIVGIALAIRLSRGGHRAPPPPVPAPPPLGWTPGSTG
ncbi:MAG: CPBP family intramembrane glutamic endopeptidase [Actinomycetota bacterium]